MFTLSLFGGVSLEGGGHPLGGRIVQRRRLALLALLASASERPVSRDKLIACLWPAIKALDRERARARRHLAQGDSDYALNNEGAARAMEGYALWKRGQKAEAIRALEYALLSLQDADPELQPRIQEARRALAPLPKPLRRESP